MSDRDEDALALDTVALAFAYQVNIAFQKNLIPVGDAGKTVTVSLKKCGR